MKRSLSNFLRELQYELAYVMVFAVHFCKRQHRRRAANGCADAD